MDKQIIISVKTILLTLLILLAGYVFYRLGPVFAILLVATLIVISVDPAINYLMSKTFLNKPVTRGLAVIVVYVLLLLVIAFVLVVGIPPVVSQIRKLIIMLTNLLSQFDIVSPFNNSLSSLLAQFTDLSGGVISFTFSFFSGLATVFSVFVLAIYMSLDWINLKQKLFSWFPKRVRSDVEDVFAEIETNVSMWIKGQLFLMFTIGFISFLGLLILGVNYPLALGLMAGILEFVPMIGPILSAVLAGIVGFSISPVKGIGVVVLFTIIQQLENNILVPKVMQKVSGFSPLIILLALLVGSEFFGLVGALLAVPVTMIIAILARSVIKYQK